MGITEEDKNLARILKDKSVSLLLDIIESGIRDKHSTDSVTIPCGQYSTAESYATEIQRAGKIGRYYMEIESVPYIAEGETINFFAYLHVRIAHSSHD